MKKLKIDVQGWGGEHTIGTITKEQAKYWIDKDEDELNDHLLGLGDSEEHDEPIDDWYEIDDVDHTYGCVLEHTIYVTVGDTESKYTDMNTFTVDNIKTITYSDLDSKTPHLICYSEEKGCFFSGELDIPDDDVVDPKNITIQTKNILGETFIVAAFYNDKEFDNIDVATNGKGFNSEIIYLDEEN